MWEDIQFPTPYHIREPQYQRVPTCADKETCFLKDGPHLLLFICSRSLVPGCTWDFLAIGVIYIVPFFIYAVVVNHWDSRASSRGSLVRKLIYVVRGEQVICVGKWPGIADEASTKAVYPLHRVVPIHHNHVIEHSLWFRFELNISC